MMFIENELETLIKAYGWCDIPSRNPYMRSYTKEEQGGRINFYFTTGTVTIDFPGGMRSKVLKKCDLETLENELMK